MSFDAYIKKYGVRVDKDYELTQPRWHEIPDTIIKRIENSTKSFNEYEQVNIENKKLLKLANTCYKLQVIRSQAKMKALINIDAFRTDLLNKKILKREYKNNITKVTEKDTKRVDFGKGIGVSIGIVEAKAIHINNSNDKLPNNIIGIFNNASPEFSTLYNKCKGIIFLKGGATSHGAIVAREFGIPAIISSEAEGIKDNENIKINGATGEWKKV